MKSPTYGQALPENTLSAHPADLIPITSPVVQHLPELLDVHRLAVHLHRTLLESGADPAVILSGWVEAEARGYLREAFKALSAASQIVANGMAEAAPRAVDSAAVAGAATQATAPAVGTTKTFAADELLRIHGRLMTQYSFLEILKPALYAVNQDDAVAVVHEIGVNLLDVCAKLDPFAQGGHGHE